MYIKSREKAVNYESSSFNKTYITKTTITNNKLQKKLTRYLFKRIHDKPCKISSQITKSTSYKIKES